MRTPLELQFQAFVQTRREVELPGELAHEILNPVHFVGSNVNLVRMYLNDLFDVVQAYSDAQAQSDKLDRANRLAKQVDLLHIKDDLMILLGECEQEIAKVQGVIHREMRQPSRCVSPDDLEH
jgi:gamma-glutamylcysteine synthetase